MNKEYLKHSSESEYFKDYELDAFIDTIFNFNKLSQEIRHFDERGMSLSEVYMNLNGHNYENNGDKFDVNYKNICATVQVKNGTFSLNDDSLEIWVASGDNFQDTYIGDYSFKEVQRIVAEQCFDKFLKKLQDNPYSVVNVYFAWKKLDNSTYMIGTRSSQLGHILKYSYDKSFGKYTGAFESIDKNVIHMDSSGEYNPVDKICEEIKGYKYVGGWNDPDYFMQQNWNTVMAQGRWTDAKKNIFKEAENTSLDDMISQVIEKIPVSGDKKPVKDIHNIDKTV